MEFIGQYWQQLVALCGVGVWLVRLESSVKRLDKQRTEDLVTAEKSREATNIKLDRMDDKNERNFQEIRTDIKALIRQGTAQP